MRSAFLTLPVIIVKPTINYTLARLGMQIAFGRVRRKTSPARKYVLDCYSLNCPRIFGLYYSFK
jgi:hypothetical protein